MLFWTAPRGKGWKDAAVKYAVYRFNRGEKVDINNTAKLVTITGETHYDLPAAREGYRYVYAVTALDRVQNESSYKKIKVNY